MAKTIKPQIEHVIENEFNYHMFFRFVVTLRIDSLSHPPRMNRQMGRSIPIQVESDDFSIMERWPKSEPVMKLLRSAYRSKFWRQRHETSSLRLGVLVHLHRAPGLIRGMAQIF